MCRNARARARAACRGWWPAAALCLGLWTSAEVAHAQVQVIGPEPDVRDPASIPERHQVKDGETLSSIAEKFLGNGDAWPKLWSYNPEITNPHWIYPGLVLKLKTGVSNEGPIDAQPSGAPSTTPGARPGLTFAQRRIQNQGSGTVVLGEQVYLDKDALEQAARIVGSSEDHLWASPTDEVYLKFREGVEPTVGKELTVFLRLHRSELRPRGAKTDMRIHRPGEAGEVVRVQGAVRVLRYDADKRIATAVVTEALDGIERGFEVADVPRRLLKVAPKTNGGEVKANIVAATRPLGLLGESQLVFLNAGKSKGVEVGNRFLVYRQGDSWRRELTFREAFSGEQRPDNHPLKDGEFPREVVAELRVLYVRPESATALITSSRTDVNPGDHAEMPSGY